MKNKIKHYKDNLYSRKYIDESEDDLEKISRLKKKKNNLDNNWESISERLDKNNNLYKYDKQEKNTFSIIFVISLIFFIMTTAVAGLFLYFQKTDIPLNQLEYSLQAPNTIDSGEIYEYTLELENNTDFKFHNIEAFVKYPKGAIDAKDNYEKLKDDWEIDDILPGGKLKIKKEIVFSGSPNDEKKIQIIINYQLEGYSSILTKEKEFSVKIESAPVFVKIDTPKNIMSNEEFDIDIEVLSNSNTDLKNLVFIGKYPNGFEIIDNNPMADYSTNYKNIFIIDSLKIGEKKNIKIKAKIQGENAETKILSFVIGSSDSKSNEILTEYFNAKEKIILKKPSLNLKLFCNNTYIKEHNVIINAGTILDCKYKLYNNLTSKITNISLDLEYQDDLLVEEKIKAVNSFIDSNNNIISWNKNNDSVMSVLKPGNFIEGELSLPFKSVRDLAGYVKNPNTLFNFKLKGTNFDNENSIGNVHNEIKKEVKLNTDIILESETNFYHDEEHPDKYSPWENLGGVNPKVGEKNTYAITWKLYNSTNRIKDIKVVARLPLWVKFENVIFPEGNYVTYNKNTREVKWSIKKIEPFIGYRTDPKKVSFKISYIPVLNQVGSYIELVGTKKLIAKDEYTLSYIETSTGIDNTFIDDGNVPYGTGRIILK